MLSNHAANDFKTQQCIRSSEDTYRRISSERFHLPVKGGATGETNFRRRFEPKVSIYGQLLYIFLSPPSSQKWGDMKKNFARTCKFFVPNFKFLAPPLLPGILFETANQVSCGCIRQKVKKKRVGSQNKLQLNKFI